MTTQKVIRVPASPIVVHDGDSYLMLLDLRGRGLLEDGCVTEWVRLRDYSARELSDTAPTDPKGWGRVDGPTAKSLAGAALHTAQEVMVELVGADQPTHSVSGESLGRLLAWIWVDGEPLGPLLEGEHAVAQAAIEGEPA